MRGDTVSSVRPMTRPERLLLGAGVAGLLVFAASTVLRSEGAYLAWADLWLYCGIGLVWSILCAGRAIRDPRGRVAWLLVAAALGARVCGDAAYDWVVVGNPDAPYPSIADAFYLAYFPLLYAALGLLLMAALPRFLPSMWLDAVVGGLGAAALGYVFVFDQAIALSGTDRLAEAVTNLAYPVGDLLLLIVVAGAFAALGLRTGPAWWLLLLGLATVAVVDTVFAMGVSAGTYVAGGPLDVFWPLSGLLVALASVSPPVTAVVAADGHRWWSELLVPGFFAMSSVLVLVVAEGPGVGSYLAAAAVVVAMIRGGLTFREVSALAEIRRQARTDDLTGLANRRGLNADLHEALARRTAAQSLAVLLIDLDRFKEVNDALGHQVGDDLLRQVGARLAGCVRPQDRLARLGGDEFAILLTGSNDAETASDVAQRVQEALTSTFELQDIALHVGVSIGVALCPEDDVRADSLLRKADVAMYAAKVSGGGFSRYDAATDTHSRDRLQTIEQLRTAIDRGELVLHYQPKVGLATDTVVGVEALVRWDHPQRGHVPPDEFIPLAEQTGLMRPLTEWLLEEALSQVATWRAAGLEIPVAVNVSTSNLLDAGLPVLVAQTLEQHDLPPRLLQIEVTESTMMADPVRAQHVVESLHDLGVTVAVDDYGTGHSSLAYLRDLSVSQLKLDRGFVHGVATDERAAAIVRSTVDLAHSLGLTMVAEGVEDKEAAEALNLLGCDIAQGYLYSRPVPGPALEQWLLAREKRRRDLVRVAG